MNKVVLITGVAGGIGSATARVFNEAGWRVIGVDLRQTHTLPGVQHFIHADISDIAASQRIFAEVAEDEGRTNALINNAALQICKPLVETTPDEWDAVMASNVRSVYLAVCAMPTHSCGPTVEPSLTSARCTLSLPRPTSPLCCKQWGVAGVDAGSGR